MRFRLSVRMVMGLAAAGGAIVALSGTAAAADASSVNTAAQTSQQVPTSLPSVPPVSNVTIPSNQTNLNSTSQTSTTQDGGGVTKSSSDSNNSSNGGDSAAKSQPNSVNADSANGGSTGGGTGLKSSSVEKVQPGTTDATVSKNAIDGMVESIPDSAKVESAVKSGAPSLQSLPPVVRFKSEMLPVQPTIVSHELAPVDLASALPSAPQQGQQPHPAKSTGMLGSLTAVLAGTVVPQPMMLGGMGIVPLATALLSALMAVLLFTVFVFTYGSWLRRGGFATAARSDEPVFSNISSIATPLFLGYVMPLRRLHNPILVVADTQIFYKVLPPMFTERRIRI